MSHLRIYTLSTLSYRKGYESLVMIKKGYIQKQKDRYEGYIHMFNVRCDQKYDKL